MTHATEYANSPSFIRTSFGVCICSPSRVGTVGGAVTAGLNKKSCASSSTRPV